MFRIFLCLLVALPLSAFTQYGDQWSSAEIQHEIKKLNTLGRVLYIAAHPDDENTRLITHLVNQQRVEVAYLSLTRGDGGQNLIGTEIGAELGLIRTQELLAARRVDGGKQFFTRAVDFGYSKNPEETFEFWDRDVILEDVVWVIRKFQPDVIINRFAHEDYRGHGHHTASALLSIEAFDLAADPNAYPHQLEYVDTWQPRQLWHNVSSWWDKTLPERVKTDSSIIAFEVSHFEPLLGRSMGEIASISRSQHRSQGFGTTLQRGSDTEYLQWIKGERTGDALFTEESLRWSSLKGGEKVEKLITDLLNNYDVEQPEKSVPQLIDVAKAIKSLPDSRYKSAKLKKVEEIIAQSVGLWFEANTGYYEVLPGSSVKVDLSFLNRSEIPVTVNGFQLNNYDTTFHHTLHYNRTHLIPVEMQVQKDHPYSEQFWLKEPPQDGKFIVEDQMLRGLPESDWPFSAVVQVAVHDYHFEVNVPVTHKWADRAKGEQIRLLTVVPALSVNPAEDVVMALNQQPADIHVRLKAHANMQHGKLRLMLPKGWASSPEEINFELNHRNEEEVFTFSLHPGADAEDGEVKVVAETEFGAFDKSVKTISYDHIPTQQLLYPAKIKAVSFDLAPGAEKIGYLMGSGDDVPEALFAMGYHVQFLTVEEIGTTDLSSFDAIVVGIRAYNVHTALAGVNHRLMKYVENGGNLVVQYNVSRGLVTTEIGPFPFQISRDRVTDEHAEPAFVDKNHAVLNWPNKLTAQDFEGWVQERGLYFADEWDPAFETVISWNDSGEPASAGGLIIANHGQGTFIYTGISFFRQLPAGVPGAYRLLANLIAYGQNGK